MSFYFNGAQANVVISGGITTQLPSPGASQTIVNVNGSAALSSSSTTAYTVTASKVFYVTSLCVSNTGNAGTLTIKDNATGKIIIQCASVSTGGNVGDMSFPSPLPFSTSIVITASGVAGTVYYSFTGWEQ